MRENIQKRTHSNWLDFTNGDFSLWNTQSQFLFRRLFRHFFFFLSRDCFFFFFLFSRLCLFYYYCCEHYAYTYKTTRVCWIRLVNNAHMCLTGAYSHTERTVSCAQRENIAANSMSMTAPWQQTHSHTDTTPVDTNRYAASVSDSRVKFKFCSTSYLLKSNWTEIFASWKCSSQWHGTIANE